LIGPERADDAATSSAGRRNPAAAGETLHNRMAVLRVERGVTRRQLAEAVGVHYQTVGYLERGEYSPSLHLALRIADFFGVSVETVFAIRPFPRIGAIPEYRADDTGSTGSVR